MSHKLIIADVMDGLRQLDDESVDSIVTDPPYGLSFMGKKWDYDVPSEDVWVECLRVLKPGGHLLSFAGSRTYHRMAVRIEDAGFEIRDQIMWIYGSGFPKSLDVSKAIDKAAGVEREVTGKRNDAFLGGTGNKSNWRVGESAIVREVALKDTPATEQAKQWEGWGSALKPAHEPIVLARKPLCGTIAQNVLEHGTGGLNIDGCRVGTSDSYSYPNGAGGCSFTVGGGIDGTRTDTPSMNTNGRFPANIIHDGSDEVVELFPHSKEGNGKIGGGDGEPKGLFGLGSVNQSRYPGEGSAARFFKQVKCDNDLWQDQSRQQSSANIAEHHSFQSVQDVVSALDLVVKREVPGGRLSSDTTIHFTTVTANECVIIYEAVTQLIQSLDKRFWQESPPESIIQSNSLARVAVTRKQTDTTTITVSLSKSGGYVEVVTFSIMQPSTEHGAKDCLHGHKFRYCAKASKRDRDEGLDGFAETSASKFDGGEFPDKRGVDNRSTVRRNHHPTVKPTDLMKYLCRLITPPNGIVLDPFMGSGSTGKGAVLEGFRFIGIEREPEYFEIAKARIEHALKDRQLSLEGIA